MLLRVFAVTNVWELLSLFIFPASASPSSRCHHRHSLYKLDVNCWWFGLAWLGLAWLGLDWLVCVRFAELVGWLCFCCYCCCCCCCWLVLYALGLLGWWVGYVFAAVAVAVAVVGLSCMR